MTNQKNLLPRNLHASGLLLILAILLCLVISFSPKVSADDPTSDLGSAEELYLNEQYEQALPIFLEHGTPGWTSPTGDLIAQGYLGEMFYYGEGVTQSYSVAMVWYLRSAEQGDPQAAYSLGVMYENGEGADKSLDRAIEWYKLAIERGSQESTVNLALIYLYDEFDYKDIATGLAMLKEYAELGNVDAQYYLGSAYYNGEVLEKDLELALKYFRMAENQEDAEALDVISWILDEDEFQKSYLEYIDDMQLSVADESAFKCENITWTMALSHLEEADETGNEELGNFAEKALSRIDGFGESLNYKIRYQESYHLNQSFREIDWWLTSMFEEANKELLTKAEDSPDSFSSEELMIWTRLLSQGGISEIVFHPSFDTYFGSIPDDDLPPMWDECISKHMPDGLFSSDIGLNALLEALEEREAGQSPMTQISNWSKNSLRTIKELSVCEGDFNTVGGFAIGSLATSVLAGDSILMLIGTTGAFIATVPAIATTVTVAAFVGSAVYLTSKGYCYVKDW